MATSLFLPLGLYLEVPNELERSVGFPVEHTAPGTEMTTFALRCAAAGVCFSWLDAGMAGLP